MKEGRVRVAHLITGLGQGGAETVLERVVSSSDSSYLNNAVWSLRSEGIIARRITSRGISVSSLDASIGLSACRAWLRLQREIQLFNPDIIQGWMYHGNIISSMLRMTTAKSAALMWNVRSSLKAFQHQKATTRMIVRSGRYLSKKVDCILTNSYVSYEEHVNYGYRSDNWQIVPNGFDADFFRPSAEARSVWRSLLRLPSCETLIVGCVGRNHQSKGHGLFIDSIRELRSRGCDVHGVLVGPGWEPDAEASMKLVKDNPGSFSCLGRQERMSDVYPAFDIFCLPSLSEAFPNALGEAMSCGVCCVATDVGDVAQMTGGLAEVVPSGSVPALSRAIARLASMSNGERLKLGAEARERIVNNYSLKSMSEKYTSIYKDISRARRI